MDNSQFRDIIEKIRLFEDPAVDPHQELISKIKQYSRSSGTGSLNKSDVIDVIKKYCINNGISEKEMNAAFRVAEHGTGVTLNPTIKEKIYKVLINGAKSNPKLTAAIGAVLIATGGYEANQLYNSIVDKANEIKDKGILSSIKDWWDTDTTKPTNDEEQPIQYTDEEKATMSQLIKVLKTRTDLDQDGMDVLNRAEQLIQ
jgi:hypothetical protein